MRRAEMTSPSLDLATLFRSASETLDQNQASLNDADPYNHDHGDNMVETFQTITNALEKKRGSTPSTQLAYASKILRSQGTSGSSKMYADGLEQAAQQFKGQKITGDNITQLIQTLLGAQPAAPTGESASNPMSGLLGSLMGGQEQAPGSSDGLGGLLGSLVDGQAAEEQATGAPDALGGILGSLLSGGQAPAIGQAGGGLDLNTLLSAGMAFLQARQQGGNALGAVVNALVSGSQMSNQPHHAQSGQMVAGALLQAASTLLGGR